ncbi:hypothetical protein BC829DRAFT_382758 [Chytridium lagenaria]|nr:hypothetical protein BC829DRAFT_382758 [Chytridium lagenaria]
MLLLLMSVKVSIPRLLMLLLLLLLHTTMIAIRYKSRWWYRLTIDWSGLIPRNNPRPDISIPIIIPPFLRSHSNRCILHQLHL